MKIENYKPEDDLKHIKGQEGIVGDLEKAREMADAQDLFMEGAAEYERYLKNPDSPQFEEETSYSPEFLEEFKEMRELGVSPDYLRKQAEIIAEQTGAVIDYRKEVQGKSDAELRQDLRKFWLKDLVWAIKNKINPPDYNTPEDFNHERSWVVNWHKSSVAQGEIRRRNGKK